MLEGLPGRPGAALVLPIATRHRRGTALKKGHMPAVIAWLAMGLTLVVDLSGPVTVAGILAVIIYASFEVKRRADALSRRLGEPVGTIILTLSIMVIEVGMVASVLLGPGTHASIARDAAFSAAMLILNGILAGAILAHVARRGPMPIRARALAWYLGTLGVLGTGAFVLPRAVGEYRGGWAVMAGVGLVAAYGVFMWRQLGPGAGDFSEADSPPRSSEPVARNLVWLVVTLVAIVALSHALGPLLDATVGNTAIVGLIVAGVVLLPETVTTLLAGWEGQSQRVSNLTHGALVSVLGGSVPAVVLIGVATGQDIVLGVGGTELALLAATLGLQATALAGRRFNAAHGLGHLTLLAAYVAGLLA